MITFWGQTKATTVSSDIVKTPLVSTLIRYLQNRHSGKSMYLFTKLSGTQPNSFYSNVDNGAGNHKNI